MMKAKSLPRKRQKIAEEEQKNKAVDKMIVNPVLGAKSGQKKISDQ